MKTSSKGLDLIKSFEGLHTTAYKCPAGVWTIGYGHTGKVNGKAIRSGLKITNKKATKLLQSDLKVFESGVKKLVKVKLNQNQFDALVSFAFNLGLGNLGQSTLLKMVNVKNFDGAAKQFLLWNKANGKVLTGLTRRREAEKKLFSTTVSKKTSTYTFKKFVKDLEKAMNLKVDGKADSALLRTLPSINRDKNENHVVIKPLKKFLKKKGYVITKINSSWDSELGSAVKKYKESHNFSSITANVGEAFWKSILKL